MLPSNEGRGYVLRRIMRRAMRHAQILGARDPLMWRLVPALTREMGQAYPELVRAEALIAETLQARGDALSHDARARACHPRGRDARRSPRAASSPGETAFGSTTLTAFRSISPRTRCARAACRVDLEGFNAAMERQRAEARRAWAGSGEAATETVWFGLRESVGATEFLGYETETAEGVVRAIVRDGAEVETLASRRERVADPQPDAVLRRVRRPGRRHRR